MIDPVEVASKVAQIRVDIASRCDHSVDIVAVTKTFGMDALRAALHAGCDAVGENYAQELLTKAEEGLPPIDVHFIGGIQSNKIKALGPHVTLWQSVDRDSVVTELTKRVPGAAVLIQVNTTGEGTKGGVQPFELNALKTRVRESGLTLRGLMTIGPTHGSDAEKRSSFSLLHSLTKEHGLEVCSMGMSDDFELAVECGSTMVRIGSRLFGARS